MTSAAQSDGRQLADVIDTNNTASDVWADTAYRSKKNERWPARNMLKSCIHHRKPKGKWQDPSTSTEQLYHFAQKVDGKMHGRGIFISVNSFSREAIRALVHGKHIKTILVDGEDINYVLEGLITLEKMLDNKIRAAQTRGEVYICAIKGTEKV